MGKSNKDRYGRDRFESKKARSVHIKRQKWDDDKDDDITDYYKKDISDEPRNDIDQSGS